MKANTIASNFIIVSLILVALYFGKDLIVPFVIALVIWYLLNAINNVFARIKIKGKQVFNWYLQAFLSGLVIFAFSYFIVKLVVNNLDDFYAAYPTYHSNFIHLTSSVTSTFDIPLALDEVADNIKLPELISNALDSSLGLLSSIFLIILYVIFLLIEQQIFGQKLKLIFKERKEYVNYLRISKKVDKSVHMYVSIKTALCFSAGLLSYLVMVIIGVDFAVLWAVLIFLLNFIPIIGALLGVIFPALIAALQFGTYLEPILVLSIISGIQLFIGNFVEPKILGTKLNLSPLVVIIALTFWGTLWGIVGMFLCVPITVIMMIVFSQFESTRKIAILLSGGKVLQ